MLGNGVMVVRVDERPVDVEERCFGMRHVTPHGKAALDSDELGEEIPADETEHGCGRDQAAHL